MGDENVSGVGYKEPMTYTSVFRDLSDLPKAKPATGGEPPDEVATIGRVLIDKWHREAVERDKRFRDLDQHGIEGVRFYHSHAADCSRAIAYAALGVEESNPVDAAGHYIMRLGSLIHDEFQAAVQEAYPGAKVEVETVNGEMGGHADVELDDGRVISIELKSQGGVAYKIAVGDRNAAAGPKLAHKVQAALNARGRAADLMKVIYLTRDAIGINVAGKRGIDEYTRVVAEWTYTRDQYEQIADKEIWRVNKILELVDGGTLPARKIPEMAAKYKGHDHVVTDPLKGTTAVYDIDAEGKEQAVDVDEAWNCAYCRWQTTCARTGSHREPVDVLVRLGVLGEEAQSGGPRE